MSEKSIAVSVYRGRRERFIEQMRCWGSAVAVIPGAPECYRNRDTAYLYRFDSYFYYLTGFTEPDTALVIVADGDHYRCLLFCRRADPDRQIWEGFHYGPDAGREIFGFDAAYAIDDLPAQLASLMMNRQVLWYSPGYEQKRDALVMTALNAARGQARMGQFAPDCIRDPRTVLDEMRLIKDDTEIALMKQAGVISAAAHCQAMLHTQPGCYEYEIDAVLSYVFRKNGSEAPAYPSIVASGENSCVLHYVTNNRQMQNGDLLLIDAGCELQGYASDISRTFPVNGCFSPEQRAVYDVVLAAQHAARAQIKPGASWNDPHDAAVKVIAQGLIDLGILNGVSLDAVLEQGLYRRFYMHRTGHWLGMDVHDAGACQVEGQWRPLLPGMVLTVEPGCYIRSAPDVPEQFWNIGIRIEDNALVTADGCVYLTDGVPRETSDIEALMQQ